MKGISIYINEKLRISKSTPKHAFVAKTRGELINYIRENYSADADYNDVDVSYIENMSGVFGDPTRYSFHSLDISEWDVSNATETRYMFIGQEQINPDLSNWDVSKVKNMNFMFEGCSNFNCDLSKWNVSNVKHMDGTFGGCKKFNSDISTWDVSNVINMTRLFDECESFNQDITGWDVSNVENMSYMFKKCISFNQDISKWKINKNTIATKAFDGCSIKEEYKFKTIS